MISIEVDQCRLLSFLFRTKRAVTGSNELILFQIYCYVSSTKYFDIIGFNDK
jgi:hypothetical protein